MIAMLIMNLFVINFFLIQSFGNKLVFRFQEFRWTREVIGDCILFRHGTILHYKRLSFVSKKGKNLRKKRAKMKERDEHY